MTTKKWKTCYWNKQIWNTNIKIHTSKEADWAVFMIEYLEKYHTIIKEIFLVETFLDCTLKLHSKTIHMTKALYHNSGSCNEEYHSHCQE